MLLVGRVTISPRGAEVGKGGIAEDDEEQGAEGRYAGGDDNDVHFNPAISILARNRDEDTVLLVKKKDSR